jgi:hypothetical protein
MRFVRPLVAIAALIAGVPAAGAEEAAPLGKGKRVLEPIHYQNLTLMPIVLDAGGDKPRSYIVLDEGMAAKKVVIHETGDGGTVNELVLENTSSEPLFLMAGEVIIGGKQDRIIGRDTILPAKTKGPVPVFCVEHGRWSGRKASFESAGALAHTELRKQAKFGGQSKVWQEVADKNAKRALKNESDTYRHVALGGGSVKSSVAGYEKHFTGVLAKLPNRKAMVGYVVAVNGQVVAIESFASPQLFAKLETKLLRSYYVEALDRPVIAGAPKGKPPTAKEAAEFAKRAQAARAKKKVSLDNAAAETVDFEDDSVIGTSVRDKNAPPAAEPAYDSVYVH